VTLSLHGQAVAKTPRIGCPITDWSAERFRYYAWFIPSLATDLVTLLDLQPDERVLDLGCGEGTLSEELVARGAKLLGVDISEELLEAAHSRGVRARRLNAEALECDNEFDVVFSHASLHLMRNPDAVIQGAYRALRPGGRFVGEFGGEGNAAAISAAVQAVCARRGIPVGAPPSQPSADEYRTKLEAAGFTVETIERIPRPTPLPTGIEGWLATVEQPMLEELILEEQDEVIRDIAEELRPVLCDATGTWTADLVSLRFSARKP
jgi:SAM-dependent methyltransferase